MDLDAILVFVKVVQAGSFTRAAKLLQMPNSTVSARVSGLEKDLGVTLLSRTTRKLSLTEAGQNYFDRCVQAVAQLEEARAELSTQQSEAHGTLKITASVDAGATLLPDVLQRYLEKFPKVQVELIITNRIVNLVEEGIDVALRTGRLEDSSLVAKKTVRVELALWASPEYLRRHGTPKRPEDLVEHNLIRFRNLIDKELTLTDSTGKRSKVRPPGRICGDDFSALKRLALRGCGVGALPTFLCQDELARGDLVRVLPKWRWGEGSFYLVYPSQRFVSPKLRGFVDCFAEVYPRE